MRLRSSFMMLSLLVAAVPMAAQWNNATSGQLTTGNVVGIGPSGTSSVVPVPNASLRLSPPPGTPDSPCTTPQADLYKCLQLAFGAPSSIYWGFRLDANNDLQLTRDYSGWKKSVTFARSGDVAVNGGARPLRLDAANANGFGVEFTDLSPAYPNGVAMTIQGNGFINVSNLQLGNTGIPMIRSTTSAPLQLNLYAPTSNVIVGRSDYNTGLRVESSGLSTFNGAVQIGGSPTVEEGGPYKFFVKGDTYVSGTVKGTMIEADYQDLAEWVPSTTTLAPGTVVVLDSARNNHVIPSARAYDTAVAGVVSAQPGIALGKGGDSKSLVATTGRVRVRVDATGAPIVIGDLLVTSDKPGLAMKSIPLDLQGIALHRPGTVVGKALEPLEGGEGEILVLLSLQ